MPEKRAGEALSAFIGRFVANKREKKQYTGLKQRIVAEYGAKRKAHG